jgi:hypothetical protein
VLFMALMAVTAMTPIPSHAGLPIYLQARQTSLTIWKSDRPC